jgi:antitoxin component of RelBE/YafQ-DinJ toxin-antitoxin module
MKIDLSIDDGLFREATRHAEAAGTTVEHLIRNFLTQFAAGSDRATQAEELRRLSREAKGDSRGWKFNREEIQRKIR